MAGDKKRTRKPPGTRSPAGLLWSFLVLGALGGTLYLSFDLYRYIAHLGEQALAEGRRAVIDVPTGKIDVAPNEKKSDAEKKPFPDAAKAKPAPEAVKDTEHAPLPKEPAPAPVADKKPETSAKPDAATTPHDTVAIPATAGEDLPTLTPKHFTGKVGILVTGLGMNRDWTQAAFKLPKEVALSFSPYTVDIATLAGEAAKSGHALFIDLPTETTDYPYTDPGPYALLAGAEGGQNMFRLQTLLNLVNNVQGVYLNRADSLSKDEAIMVPILDRIAQQKKALVFYGDEKNQFAADQAHALGIPYLNRYLQLDETASSEALLAKMKQLYAQINDNKGNILLVLRPYPGSLTQTERFLKDFQAAGYQLAPAADILVK